MKKKEGEGRTSLDRRQSEVSSHQVILSSSERLDLPDEGSLFGSVVDSSDGGLSIKVKRERDEEGQSARRTGGRREEKGKELTLNFGESASSGTGTKISTLLAVLRRLN